MRSLFVVSLPRSLSSLLYVAASRALGLAEPGWTTDGEILNRDRVPRRLQHLAPADERFTLLGSRPDRGVAVDAKAARFDPEPRLVDRIGRRKRMGGRSPALERGTVAVAAGGRTTRRGRRGRAGGQEREQ